jgi:hypothetical protein
VIKHFIGGNQGKAEARRSRTHLRFMSDVLFSPVSREQTIKAISEGVAQLTYDAFTVS